MFVVQELPEGCTPKKAYVRSWSGILKISQMLLSMITFAMSMSFPYGSHGSGWVGTASLNGFVVSTVWFCLHTFGVLPGILINYYVELIVYSIWTFFYLIAGIVAATAGHYHSVIAVASFLSFVCMILFGIDVYKQFHELRATQGARNQAPQPSESSGGTCPSHGTVEQTDNTKCNLYPGSGKNNDFNNCYEGNFNVFVSNDEESHKDSVPLRHNAYSLASNDTSPVQGVSRQDNSPGGVNAGIRMSVKIQPIYTSLYN